ncbi:hypothetical protein [Helicobacter sp.]|uniref:hypothetical protein n=1 Tax=Helicobacter sp. TaxID=218 RepID=UPI00388D1D42
MFIITYETYSTHKYNAKCADYNTESINAGKTWIIQKDTNDREKTNPQNPIYTRFWGFRFQQKLESKP